MESTTIKCEEASSWIFNRNETPSWKIIFNNKIENFAIFSVLMLGVLFYQIMQLFLCFFKKWFAYGNTKKQEEKTKKQEERNIQVNAWNLLYFVFGFTVFLTSDVDKKYCNRWGLHTILLLFFIRLLLLEIGQLTTVVLEPSWR